jgi:hypothetical protein
MISCNLVSQFDPIGTNLTLLRLYEIIISVLHGTPVQHEVAAAQSLRANSLMCSGSSIGLVNTDYLLATILASNRTALNVRKS